MTEKLTAEALDMLAYDIADLFGDFNYPLNASQEDIRPHLPAFLAAIEATAKENGS